MRGTLRAVSIVLSTLLGFAVLPPAISAEADIPLRVSVDGAPGYVPEGTTIGELLDILGKRPGGGDLVSVTGRVLKPGTAPGRILRDGAEVPREQVLIDGDDIVLEHSPDIREPVERIPAPAVGLGNPIRTIPVYYGLNVVQLRGKISHEVIQEGATGAAHAAVALTFDDGPNPAMTLRILAVLNKYKIKATFFTVGRWASAYPWIVRQLYANGMAVENHSWAHENFARMRPSAQWASLINETRALRAAGLPLPRWFRPPYGSYTQTTVRLASQLGMRTAIWSVDPYDWKRPSPRIIAARVLSQVRPGGVILMHDGGGDRTNTLNALPTIIEALLHRGYRFVTL